MRRARLRGVALVAVLWLVSALALIALGAVKSVRLEIKSVAQDRDTVTSSALADAAIVLALQQLQQTQFSNLKPMQIIPVEFEGNPFQVAVTGLNGLIDLNLASEALLTALYFHAGGMPEGQAKTLARASVEYRQFQGESRTKRGIAASEDLLSVPGFTYDLYVKIRDLVTADLQEGGGKVNPLAAPVGVLQVLNGGNYAGALDMASRRGSGAFGIDPAALKAEFIDSTVPRSFILSTTVNLASGAELKRAWTVYLGVDPKSRLPWRQFNTNTSFLSPKE